LLLVRLAPEEDAHDVDAGNDSAVLALRPSHEGKDAARRETDDAAATVDDLLVGLAAEAYPVLDLAFLEGQLDQCGEGRRPVRQRTAVRAAVGATGHCSSPGMCWGLRERSASSAGVMARPFGQNRHHASPARAANK